MSQRIVWNSAAAFLVLSFPAHAHGIHPMWVAGALSPLLVLLFTAVLGWLARSARLGLVHAALILVWVALFWLASNLVTNDYLIWAPLVIYMVHSLIIIALTIWHALSRR